MNLFQKRLMRIALFLLLTGILSACAGTTEPTWQEEMLPRLPEGLSLAEQEGKTFILQENSVVGGLDCYRKPEVQPDPFYHWIHDLPLWENSDNTLGYSGGGSLYGDWELHYFTDLPPEQIVRKVERFHTFYVTEKFVYDIWFDSLLLDSDTIAGILETIEIAR